MKPYVVVKAFGVLFFIVIASIVAINIAESILSSSREIQSAHEMLMDIQTIEGGVHMPKFRWIVTCDENGRKSEPELQYLDDDGRWEVVPVVEVMEDEDASVDYEPWRTCSKWGR